jgi:hypothetical protein
MDTIPLEEFEHQFRPRVKNNTALKELVTFNILTEYEAISKKPNKDKYDLALLFLFKYIFTAVKQDPYNGDYNNEKTIEMTKRAGQLLYEYGGEAMMDRILLFCVPPRYRREIEYIWSGIGEWLA